MGKLFSLHVVNVPNYPPHVCTQVFNPPLWPQRTRSNPPTLSPPATSSPYTDNSLPSSRKLPTTLTSHLWPLPFRIVLLLIKMVMEYCSCADDLPMLITDVLSKLVEILKVTHWAYQIIVCDVCIEIQLSDMWAGFGGRGYDSSGSQDDNSQAFGWVYSQYQVFFFIYLNFT